MTRHGGTKLIEVALPIEAINEESSRDKKLSSGHPTTLHYWWAPRPLPACRAVVFASLVDDPSAHPDRFPDEEAQERERDRLFDIIRRLIRWESRFDQSILAEAREEIRKSTGGEPPTMLDPFCGRGLIPLEGQRLGLKVLAGDLNPVAVTIAKMLLEVLPSFSDRVPVHPREDDQGELGAWSNTRGFSEDAAYYARQTLEACRPELEPLFPEYEITPDLIGDRPELDSLRGEKLPVMGWLWARTVRCANPSCGFTIPLTGSFWLCKKKGKRAWLEPQVPEAGSRMKFRICTGEGAAPDPTKLSGTSGSFRCPACGEVTEESHLEAEGRAGRIGEQMMACILDGGRSHGRIYVPPTAEQEAAAERGRPQAPPDYPLPDYSQAMPTIRHGVRTWADMFTARQLVTLEALSAAVVRVRGEVEADAIAAGYQDDGELLESGGRGGRAYADAIATFLGLVVGKYVNRSCSFCFWDSGSEKIQQPFAQQGIQKTWDFVEANPFSGASGSWESAVEYPRRVIGEVAPGIEPGRVVQQSAEAFGASEDRYLIVTDPPYYDNMGYADLSDIFYIWMRRALQDVYPDMFGTMLTPKEEELAAVRHRFGGDREEAEGFFVDAFSRTFGELARVQEDDYPLAFFYAYKQSEKRGGEVEVSTGWETMLVGLIEAGFTIVGTWPILSESIDTIKKGKSSLSTSVVLVCRKRKDSARMITRRQFIDELSTELPDSLEAMQAANIAPVDLAQAAIGPGMEVFSRHERVVETDGSPMTVRTALQLINQVLDEVLSEQEAEFDAETRWAVAWYRQYGTEDGPYGVAESLATAKNVSVRGLSEAGVVASEGGRVRLLHREEMDAQWDPAADSRLTVWETTQHLTKRLLEDGEDAAAELVARLGGVAEVGRSLAYQLFQIAERNGWSREALAFNALVTSWPELRRLGQAHAAPEVEQVELLDSV